MKDNGCRLPEGYRWNERENRELLRSPAGLMRAAEEGTILEAVVRRCDDRYQLTLDLTPEEESGRTRRPCSAHNRGTMPSDEETFSSGVPVQGILPREELQDTPPGEEAKEIAAISRVGKVTCFRVMEVKQDENGQWKAILSRRAAQEDCRKRYLSALTPGDVIPAKVTHLENFGAFVDIGCGIVSLLPIDSMSVSRISHPADRFRVGDRISVVVRAIDRDGEGTATRLYVTYKELLGTWEENAAAFAPGQTVSGIVRSVESYGVFVELTPNLAGLAERREDVEPGQTAAVYIKNIIPERMKIKLVLIDGVRCEPLPRRICEAPPGLTHLASWRYSPSCCDRVIETVFDGRIG